MTPRRLIRIAATHALRLIPKRHRFAAVCAVARLAPRRASFGQSQLAILDDGPTIALFGILWNLTRERIEYDPVIEVDGAAEVDAVRASGRGMLVVSGHFGMNHVVARWLHDRGWALLPVRRKVPHPLHVAGTATVLPYVIPGPNTLIAVRTALREGCAVIIDVETHPDRAHAIAVGPVHLSDRALRVAEKCDAEIVYLEARFKDGRVRATFTRGTREDLPSMFASWLGT